MCRSTDALIEIGYNWACVYSLKGLAEKSLEILTKWNKEHLKKNIKLSKDSDCAWEDDDLAVVRKKYLEKFEKIFGRRKNGN